MSVIVVVVILAYFKELQVTSFDPVFAQSTGMNVQFYHYLLMFLLALVSITAMQSVGTVMIVALLITLQQQRIYIQIVWKQCSF